MKEDFAEFKLSDKVKAKFKNQKKVQTELSRGKIAQQIVEFSDETMAKFYQAAYQLFEQKRYAEACNAFLFLASLNPYHHEYWLGFAMAAQLNHEYESAIDAYELAALMNITSPLPYFYLSKCLFAMHNREGALQALELAIEMADDIDAFQDIKKQAISAKEILFKCEDPAL